MIWGTTLTMNDRYANESRDADYDHRFHAGNIGDVWKHVLLLQLLTALQAQWRELTIVDGHAGSGQYQLERTGEWTEGVGRLLNSPPAGALGSVTRYVEALGSFNPMQAEQRRYPGSPRLLLGSARTADRLEFIDNCQEYAERLTALLGNDARVRITVGGIEEHLIPLLEGYKESSSTGVLVHLDPPWRAKSDWQTIPRLLAEAWRTAPASCLALWYPIKSYTRVAKMIADLREEGVPFAAADLITTPLTLRHNRLNGSGMLIVNPPAATLAAAAAAGAQIGASCATHGGRWELRIQQ